MADEFDPNPELSAEYQLALNGADGVSGLLGEIRGLHALAAIDTTAETPPDLVSDINHRIMISERRRDAIMAAVAAMASVADMRRNLSDDGYPTWSKTTLDPLMLKALKREASDFEAAVGVFQDPPTNVSFDSRAPFTDVPQPRPEQTKA